MKYFIKLLIIPLVLLFSACSKKEQPLLIYPQDISLHVKDLQSIDTNVQNFRSRYFLPWRISSLKLQRATSAWANVAFAKEEKYFSENLLPWKKDAVQNIIKNTNFQAYNSFAKYAITAQETQVRNLPTLRPFYKDPSIGGEGAPFDYLQNTRLHVSEPVFISHLSLDGAWAFVQTTVSTGWVERKDIVELDAKERLQFFKSPQLLITKDNLALYDTQQNYRLHVKLGVLFPLISEDATTFQTYIYTPQKTRITISKQDAQIFPIAFDGLHVNKIAAELLGENYGWGGFMGNRDCSAMLRDYFLGFGVWLERNSFAQSKSGYYISLEGKSDIQKEEIIAHNAIAFQSLIYLDGHIMLYIGSVDKKALVMHNLWGVKIKKNGKEDRSIIGRAIISDLYLGKYEKGVIQEDLLIKRIKGLVVSPQTTYAPAHPLSRSYESIVSVANNLVMFDDNTSMPYDDGIEKTFEQALQSADIEDTLSLKYQAFEPIMQPQEDAGRIRQEDLFKKLYGANEEEIRKNLVQLIWIDGTKVDFNKKQNAAQQLQKVINELKNLPPHFQKELQNIAGTFNYRFIAGTKRLSAHSFGIAIDLAVNRANYWKWDKSYRFANYFSKEIVDIFEKHGFIWGGRWYHYDTMHFEYRPELFLSID
ncbi:MAG: SH3 domain-containing protein [Sulfurospirillum sp.]|nr:SH3 domain-containing protein [Sulfurospirillum sp.]